VTYLTAILTQPACRALGWALLQFIWQGTLAALVLAGCNFALREAPARLRYGVSCVFLVVMLALPVVTFTSSLAHAPAPQPMPRAALQVVGDTGDAASAPMIEPPAARDFFTPLLPWTVALWGLGVLALSLRWIGTWTYLHKLSRAASIPTPDEWQRALRDLMRRAAISIPVRLSLQAQIHVPCVIGWLRPVILMPVASLAGMDWPALEALLAHELAHIRRYDYLVNLLQTVVDTLLFYHPAVWWVSRQIRIERENCCDDMAAQLCGDRLIYARALVDLEQIREMEPGLVMSARGGALLQRIQRLVHPRPERRSPAWAPAAAGMAILACLAVALHSPIRAVAAVTSKANVTQATPAVAPTAMLPTARPKPIQIAPGQMAPLQMATAAAPTQEPTPEPAEESHDFLSEIVAAGFHNLSVDELIELKIHGVTPEFAKTVKAGYPNVTARELIEMAIHGVDSEYMRAMEKNGLHNLSIGDLVSLRIHGVTPDYIAELKTAGYPDLTADEYRELRIHGVDTAFIRNLNEHGMKNLSLDQLLRLKRSGF
jgi:beta-lactamase regulating signal transducer with metallopeptidase domain